MTKTFPGNARFEPAYCEGVYIVGEANSERVRAERLSATWREMILPDTPEGRLYVHKSRTKQEKRAGRKPSELPSSVWAEEVGDGRKELHLKGLYEVEVVFPGDFPVHGVDNDLDPETLEVVSGLVIPAWELLVPEDIIRVHTDREGKEITKVKLINPAEADFTDADQLQRVHERPYGQESA